MNPKKQHAKLLKLQTQAEICLSREEAKKIIRKADKANTRLSSEDIKS
ncbi:MULTISPECIES: hypothetical protein [unclassified Prochlorococcus]|nr:MULTISPECIES: hypothetical protein [unclassified Prochlorococcus]KGG16133.1 hypothetical protein EV06_0843 [Prochlorococcus sp. MIT 0602]KGG17251.1 hypothetical protein EV07_0689 [Prochlorococcus sp. MIT 0603]